MKTEANSQNINLIEENKRLKEKVEELEKRFDSREETRKKLAWWISKTVSVLGLISELPPYKSTIKL